MVLITIYFGIKISSKQTDGYMLKRLLSLYLSLTILNTGAFTLYAEESTASTGQSENFVEYAVELRNEPLFKLDKPLVIMINDKATPIFRMTALNPKEVNKKLDGRQLYYLMSSADFLHGVWFYTMVIGKQGFPVILSSDEDALAFILTLSLKLNADEGVEDFCQLFSQLRHYKFVKEFSPADGARHANLTEADFMVKVETTEVGLHFEATFRTDTSRSVLMRYAFNYDKSKDEITLASEPLELHADYHPY